MRDDELGEYVGSLVKQLLAERDDAWHSLVELGPAALPHVKAAYARTSQPTQGLLVTIVNEYKSDDALDFLLAALMSPVDEIWKPALDGLVTLGGETVRRRLENAASVVDSRKRDWIMEAHDQVQNELAGNG